MALPPYSQDDYVLWIDAPVNTGRPRVRAGVRTSREVPGRAIGGLQQDFSRPIQLRCVRVPGPYRMPGSNMAQDCVHPLQAVRAVMVQKRRMLAESLLRSREGAKAARRRKKLIKLQREIDV